MTNKPVGFGGTVLAVMLGMILVSVFDCDRKANIEKKVDKILAKQKIISNNVIGNPKISEIFYETPEGRAYLTIDGQPADEYLRSR